jgi:Fe2+ or Zn2+ uptake regulation protein
MITFYNLRNILLYTVRYRFYFTSPLHRIWCMHKHYKGRLASTQLAPTSLRELVIRIIERMDPYALQSTMSLDSEQRPLERCWQMEVYRALMQTLPKGAVPSSDVGKVRVVHHFSLVIVKR